jgi:hypothetical protein
MKKSIVAIALVASFASMLTSCLVQDGPRRHGRGPGYDRGHHYGHYYNNGGYNRGW